MAALTIVGVRDVQDANAQKNWLATVITAISVTIFVLAGVVAWPQVGVMTVGAVTGGYAGARVARHVPARLLRGAVIGVGLSLSAVYFVR